MALVLIKDIGNNGNFDSQRGKRVRGRYVTDEDGKRRWKLTGGDALELDFGKAAGLIFKTWEPVFCPSGAKQEDAILRYVEQTWGAESAPIVRLDITGRENPWVRDKFFEMHPEFLPDAEPGTVEYMSEMAELVATFNGATTPRNRRKTVGVKFDDVMKMNDSQIAELMNAKGKTSSAGRTVGGNFEASKAKGEAMAADNAARGFKSPDDVYNEQYAKHREAGHSEKKAAMYAERSRQKAEKDQG